MGREQRRELLLEVVREVVGVGRRLVEEDVAHALEQLAAALERLEGVLEDREVALAHDRLHLGELLGHAGLERRLEVLVADVGERRQPVREGAGGGERVVGGQGGAGGLGHSISLDRTTGG